MLEDKALNDFHKKIFDKMLHIRYFEENLLKLFDEGLLFGTTHTSLGQEALAVALSESIDPSQDIVFSNHRCHGHYIATMQNPKGLLLEIMGREGGICAGYGGSQHIQDQNFYSNGIQGGYVPILAGMAYAEKMKDTQNIAVGFIGDGTLGEGTVYEAFNLMSIMHTPSLILIEANKYAQSTPTKNTTAGKIIDRAQAFNIPFSELETNDAFLIHKEVSKAVSQVRETKQPYIFVHHTYRLGPHSKGDDNRPPDEIEKMKKFDPIKVYEKYLSKDVIEELHNKNKLIIDELTEFAKNAPIATLHSKLRHGDF